MISIAALFSVTVFTVAVCAQSKYGQCLNDPKPYYCKENSGVEQSEECPPPGFDAVTGFTLTNLKQYVNAPWFIQYQAPVSYQPPDQLFCVRALYRPEDLSDPTAGVTVFNYANDGEVNGRAGLGDRESFLFGAVPDPTRPSRIRVGFKFLRPLPDFDQYYGDYWIMALGKDDDPEIGFSWAVVSGGIAAKQSEFGSGCRAVIFGDPDGPPPQIAGRRREIPAMEAPEGGMPPPGIGGGGMSQGGPPFQTGNPLAALFPLFVTLGFENLEQGLFNPVFQPKTAADFDLLAVLEFLDGADARAVAPAIAGGVTFLPPEAQAFLAAGDSDASANVAAVLASTDGPIKLSQLVAAALGIPYPEPFKSVLSTQLTMFPLVLESIQTQLQEGLIALAGQVFQQFSGEGLFVLTRERVASRKVIREIFGVIRELGLDTNILQKVPQEGCKYEGAQQKKFFFPIEI